MKWAAILAGVFLALLVLLVPTVFALEEATGVSGVVCVPADDNGKIPSTVAGYGPDQLANAAQVVAAATELDLPERASVIGVATAMTESSLVNVDHGDAAGPDSRGLFQQRSSWGPESVRMDPKGAATLFFQAMLKEVPGWQSRPLTEVASAVQRNADPGAYAPHEHDAEQVVGAVKHIVCTGSGDGTKAVAAAMSQLGKPYVWGAEGPDSYDCSGLTMWAWAKAGVTIPRTSGAQYLGAGPHVPRDQLQPGDLLFFSSNGASSGIHHVGMYIGGGRMVHAPHTGDVVRVVNDVFADSYYSSQFIGAARPGSATSGKTSASG